MKKGELFLENKDAGLQFKPKSWLSSAIALSDNGYGDYRISYTVDGQERYLLSRTKMIRERHKRPKSHQEARDLGTKLMDIAYKILETVDSHER